MGNEIFWSEKVTGLQGACTHPPLDIFFESIPLKSSGSVTRYHVASCVASCTSEAFNSIFQISFEIRLMSGILFPFLKCWPKQGSGVPSGLAGIIYQSTVYELKIKTAGSK